MNKTRPLNQVRSFDADMLHHLTKVQNKSMQKGSIRSRLMEFASSVPDFRRSGKGNFRHQLKDIIMLMILGRLCGCVGRTDIIEFGKHNIKKIRKMSMLKNGMPSEATLCRVDNGINDLGMADRMQEFIKVFHSQLRRFVRDKEIICIDGKAMRGTVQENGRNPDIVSAYSFNTCMTLATEACQEKSNEIKAVPLLLDKLDFFVIFVKKCLLGRCTGISFVDSTLLRVCRNQRIHMHKVFKGIAQRGKCSMGWFYGFKLHLICNDKGEILNFMITPGDVDDREPLKVKSFVEFIYGKLVDDKGYIGKDLFRRLFIDGIQLITKLKNNMKGGLRSMYDRILLRKRAIIETINDELKNIAQIEHSRHRSFPNFIVNLIGGIAAYCLFPKKPMINFERVFDKQLNLF